MQILLVISWFALATAAPSGSYHQTRQSELGSLASSDTSQPIVIKANIPEGSQLSKEEFSNSASRNSFQPIQSGSTTFRAPSSGIELITRLTSPSLNVPAPVSQSLYNTNLVLPNPYVSSPFANPAILNNQRSYISAANSFKPVTSDRNAFIASSGVQNIQGPAIRFYNHEEVAQLFNNDKIGVYDRTISAQTLSALSSKFNKIPQVAQTKACINALGGVDVELPQPRSQAKIQNQKPSVVSHGAVYVIEKVPEVASYSRSGLFSPSDIPSITEIEAIFSKAPQSFKNIEPTAIHTDFRNTMISEESKKQLKPSESFETQSAAPISEDIIASALPKESKLPLPLISYTKIFDVSKSDISSAKTNGPDTESLTIAKFFNEKPSKQEHAILSPQIALDDNDISVLQGNGESLGTEKASDSTEEAVTGNTEMPLIKESNIFDLGKTDIISSKTVGSETGGLTIARFFNEKPSKKENEILTPRIAPDDNDIRVLKDDGIGLGTEKAADTTEEAATGNIENDESEVERFTSKTEETSSSSSKTQTNISNYVNKEQTLKEADNTLGIIKSSDLKEENRESVESTTSLDDLSTVGITLGFFQL